MLLNTIIEFITHKFGVDLFLGFDAPDRGYLDFEKRRHRGGAVEYFGAGLHLTVYPHKMGVARPVDRTKIIKMR